jgi:hypothetical protein
MRRLCSLSFILKHASYFFYASALCSYVWMCVNSPFSLVRMRCTVKHSTCFFSYEVMQWFRRHKVVTFSEQTNLFFTIYYLVGIFLTCFDDKLIGVLKIRCSFSWFQPFFHCVMAEADPCTFVLSSWDLKAIARRIWLREAEARAPPPGSKSV